MLHKYIIIIFIIPDDVLSVITYIKILSFLFYYIKLFRGSFY